MKGGLGVGQGGETKCKLKVALDKLFVNEAMLIRGRGYKAVVAIKRGVN